MGVRLRAFLTETESGTQRACEEWNLSETVKHCHHLVPCIKTTPSQKLARVGSPVNVAHTLSRQACQALLVLSLALRDGFPLD